MKNYLKAFPFLLIGLLASCSFNTGKALESHLFYFDTFIDSKLYQGDENDLKEIKNILLLYDSLADSYKSRDKTNVYTLNQTNEEVEVSEELYNLLKTSISVTTEGAENYNPLFGSLANKWKDSIEDKSVLSSAVIEEELQKINSSELLLKDDFKVQRVGEAEIDLGGIAKGYALDKVKDYLNSKEISKYLINAGSSSILLGEKDSKDGLFTIKIKDLTNAYFKAKNCFVSTSGISEQGVTIDGVTYSHIINPSTGSAVSLNDTVIVLSETGYFGDALSTSFMNNSVEEIKEIENEYSIKSIVIKNGKIIYKNSDIEVIYK